MRARVGLVVVSMILSVLIGVTFSRKGGPEPAPRDRANVVIGLSLDTLKEARWQRDRDLFVEAAKDLGADVLVESANSDDTRQMADVQALLSRGVDVLVIVPHNARAMATAVEHAHESGIPVIAYDRLITDCDLDLYVSFDNVKVGEAQAQYVVDHLPKNRRGRIVRILGAKTDNNALLFKQGQDKVLGPHLARGDLEIIHEDWADNWKPESAKKITQAAITRHGTSFDAVLASNDGTAGGAIQALIEEGLAGKVIVTGQDAELVACQRVAAGTQSMTIYKPIARLAGAAVDLAVRLAKGRPVIVAVATPNGKTDVPSQLLSVVTVTRENLESTVIADGYHARDDIYRYAPPPRERSER